MKRFLCALLCCVLLCPAALADSFDDFLNAVSGGTPQPTQDRSLRFAPLDETPAPTDVPTEAPTPAPDPSGNILMADKINGEPFYVLGSDIERSQIIRVRFLDSLEDMPEDAWDVSDAQNGSVYAWVSGERGAYELSIAGVGGVSAGASAEGLFAYYRNLEQIDFGNCFYTEGMESMCRMFLECNSLRSLDLSGFNTESVRDFSWCFDGCGALETLDLSFLDTRNAAAMQAMFYGCSGIESLDLSLLDTQSVTTMQAMFYGCSSIRSLDVSKLNTRAVRNFKYMFKGCAALSELITGDDFLVDPDADVLEMFADCPALDAEMLEPLQLGKGAVPTSTPSPAPTGTLRPTNTPRVYSELHRGNSGVDVALMQSYLVDYGYMLSGSADGEYGRKTANAVHWFKHANCIWDDCDDNADYCVATSEMLSVLYGGSAIRNIEPDVALQIFEGSKLEYNKLKGDKFKFRVQVENASSLRTVRAFELRAYITNVWEEPVYGDGYYYYETTRCTIAPNGIAYSDYLIIPNRSDIYKVWVGISRVEYNDGTYAEADEIDYWYWTFDEL